MNKTFTICAATVLATAGLFADMPNRTQASNPCACLEQGMGLPSDKKCFPAAYNAPAGINVSCGWDFSVFGSFIYWHTSQENMDVARAAPDGSTTPPTSGQLVYQEFSYKPGFKAGFGFDAGYDDWMGWVEYTWMHQTTSGSSVSDLRSRYSSPDWMNLAAVFGATEVASKWKMHLDILDAVVSRPFYQGTQLTVSPYSGLRALWIRQQESINYTVANNLYVKAKSQAWSVGPVVGALGHWMLGMGFRGEGKAEAALLYTKYTTVANAQKIFTYPEVSTSSDDYSAIRPMMTLGLGLGWGSYLSCQKYYLDFAARYDFNILWNQNVMRSFAAAITNGTDGNVGDLFIHGVTISSSFNF